MFGLEASFLQRLNSQPFLFKRLKGLEEAHNSSFSLSLALHKKTSLYVHNMLIVAEIKNNMIMKQMRWKNHLFQLFVTRKK